MEFDFNQFELQSHQPLFKLERNNTQFFRVTEKKKPDRTYTLIMMDGNSFAHSETIKTHLQCQSASQGVVKLKGFKEMNSVDQFGFRVERTGWLIEELSSTLLNYCQDFQIGQLQIQLREPHSISQLNESGLKHLNFKKLSFDKVKQLVVELSTTLAELQEEEITLTQLTMNTVVLTSHQVFKLWDLTSAINLIGMNSSMTRKIQGDAIYLDPEAHKALLQGDSYAIQNYYKSNVYALGIIILQVCTLKFFDRRQTQQELEVLINLVELNYGVGLASLLNNMLLQERNLRPDCLELRHRVSDLALMIAQPPLLLSGSQNSLNNDSAISLAFSNTQVQTQQQKTKYQEQFYEEQKQQATIFDGLQYTNTLPINLTNSEYIQTNNQFSIQIPTDSNEVFQCNIFQFYFQQVSRKQLLESDQGSGQTSQIEVVLPSYLKKEIRKYQQDQFKNRESFQEQGRQGADSPNKNSSLLIVQQKLDELSTIPRISVKDIKLDKKNFLGRGTEGMVYLCSIGCSQNLAVKILEDIENTWALQLLLITSSVQARNIKGIFKYNFYAIEPINGDIKSLRCNLYLVSNRMRCDLAYANQNLKLSDNQKLLICFQIGDVLRELENRVIHGDLKPQNILLDAQNNIGVIDFGMSRALLIEQSIVESTGHTYLYSPPEQVLFKNAHPRSDIWSFGIIIYELFSGKEITQELIYEMGMYDSNRKGCLKIRELNHTSFQDRIFRLIEKMTQFDYDCRPRMEDVIKVLQTLHITQPKTQRKNSNSASKQKQSGHKSKQQNTTPKKQQAKPCSPVKQNTQKTQLMILGKQIKQGTDLKPLIPPKTPQTYLEKRENIHSDCYNPYTQVTKRS